MGFCLSSPRNVSRKCHGFHDICCSIPLSFFPDCRRYQSNAVKTRKAIFKNHWIAWQQLFYLSGFWRRAYCGSNFGLYSWNSWWSHDCRLDLVLLLGCMAAWGINWNISFRGIFVSPSYSRWAYDSIRLGKEYSEVWWSNWTFQYATALVWCTSHKACLSRCIIIVWVCTHHSEGIDGSGRDVIAVSEYKIFFCIFCPA